jgi:ribosomal-protein-alanine N-acetyltransferase
MDRTVNSKDHVIIGPMAFKDLASVIALEERYGLNSLGRDRFEREIATESSIMVVARSTNPVGSRSEVVGSLSGWVVADEFQIDNIVVAEARRRSGIGLALLQTGARRASRRGATKAVLEVRAGNLPARMLYQKLGFVISARRSQYYQNPPDDALVMVCSAEDWKGLVAPVA